MSLLFQVLIGTGCFEHLAYVLDYGGPFHCKVVQYMTGGIIGGALFAAVLVLACYKGKKRLTKMKIPFPIRSVYPGFPTNIYRDMPRPGVGTIFDRSQ